MFPTPSHSTSQVDGLLGCLFQETFLSAESEAATKQARLDKVKCVQRRGTQEILPAALSRHRNSPRSLASASAPCVQYKPGKPAEVNEATQIYTAKDLALCRYSLPLHTLLSLTLVQQQ